MAHVVTSSETEATRVERFKNDSISGATWLLIGCLAGFLALAIYERIDTKSPMFTASLVADIVILCSIFLLLSVPLIVVWIQSRTIGIIADTDALTWKTRRGTFCSPWSDVLDFYETADSAKAKIYVVHTKQGDFRFSSMWTRDVLLKSLIVERAVNARAKQWEILDARPDLDWPKTFDYSDGTNRWGIPIIRIGCYLYMIWIVVEMGPGAWRMASEIAAYSGWLLGSVVLLVSAFVYFSTPMLCLCVFPSFGELRRRRTQTIILSQDGIVYKDRTRTIEARWDKITRLTYNHPGPCIVATKQGTFDFRITMRGGNAVFRAIKAMTAATLPDGWQSKTSERLDHPNRRALTVPFGQEAQVFSYRTRTNRALIVMGVFFFGVQGVVVALKGGLSIHGLPMWAMVLPVLIGLFLIGGVALTLWGWLLYLTGSIAIDDTGIRQVTLFGHKRIAWEQVTGLKAKGDSTYTFVLVTGPAQRIWFSLLIADCKKLVTEIKARAPEGVAFSAEDAERVARLVGQD